MSRPKQKHTSEQLEKERSFLFRSLTSEFCNQTYILIANDLKREELSELIQIIEEQTTRRIEARQ